MYRSFKVEIDPTPEQIIAEKSFRSVSICSSCGYTEDRSLNASCNLRDMVIYTTG